MTKNVCARMLLSTTMALSVLAGCQAVAPTAGGSEGNIKRGDGNTAAVTDKKAGAPEVDGLPKVEPDVKPATDASGGALVDKAPSMHITAADGGTYVSPDGLLTVTFPPGALSKDVDVKFARVDTSKMKNSNVLLQGMRFQMDIGDAEITPGSKLQIASKADDRMVGELKSMYDDFTPERYSLSQDAKGNWMVTMSYGGPMPSVATDDMSGGTAPTRGLMVEGAAPLPAKTGGFSKLSRIEAFCNYNPPPLPAVYGPVCTEVHWISDDPALNGQLATSSGAADPGTVRVQYTNNPTPGNLAPQYTALPDIPQVDVNQYGQITAPPEAVGNNINSLDPDRKADVQTALNAWARHESGAAGFKNFDQTDYVLANGQNFPLPLNGSPPASPAEVRTKLIDRVTDLWSAPATVTTSGDVNETYSAGGHSCSDASLTDCAGGYVFANLNTPIIDPNPGALVLAPDGFGRIRALQSDDLLRAHGGATVGRVTFRVSSNAYITFPKPVSDRPVPNDGFSVDAVLNRDTATPGCGGPLRIQKFAPHLYLHMTNESTAAYGQDSSKPGMIIEWELDGTKLPDLRYTLSPGSGATIPDFDQFDMWNYVHDDQPHQLKIIAIHTEDDLLFSKPQDLSTTNNRFVFSRQIQRNGGYDINVTMLLNNAK